MRVMFEDPYGVITVAPVIDARASKVVDGKYDLYIETERNKISLIGIKCNGILPTLLWDLFESGRVDLVKYKDDCRYVVETKWSAV